jgi:hypothetical protein
MKRVHFALRVLIVATVFEVSAWATPSAAAAVESTTQPAASGEGVAVVALPAATDAAWPLAQAIYGDASLRANTIDEAYARILCGEPPAPGASAEERDVADTIAAVRGDDAPSRALLSALAHRFGLRALVVVRVDGGHPVAHVFLADLGAFDAATYVPDAGRLPVSWSAAARSLARTLGSAPPTSSAAAPALATHEVPPADGRGGHRLFYSSPWFWGAVGLAAAAAGVTYLLTRDSGSPTIHLVVQVPHP